MGDVGWICRGMLLLIDTEVLGSCTPGLAMLWDSCSHSQTDHLKWCFTLHCKSSPPSFFLDLFFLSFFPIFFFGIAVQSFAHHPKSQLRPDAEGQMKQWMYSARWFPHEQGSVPVKEVNSLQKPPKNKALEKGSTLLAHLRRKGVCHCISLCFSTLVL